MTFRAPFGSLFSPPLGLSAAVTGDPLLDYFADTDTTALASHIPDSNPAGGGWTVETGTWVITSNRATAAGTAFTTLLAHANAGVYNGVATGIAQVTQTGNIWGVVFRFSDTSNYWYARAAHTGNLRIYDVQAGTPTIRASVVWTGSINTDYTLIVTLSGNSITAAIGATTASYTSSFNATATRFGLYANNQTTAANTKFDSIQVV